MTPTDLFAARRADALRRIGQVRADLAEHLAVCEHPAAEPAACIYATGSLARLEASSNSDLDAFFLLSGHEADKPIGRVRDVRIFNAFVLAGEKSGFPDFSGGGEYLKFLYVEDMLRHLGDRMDDYNNALTARMLIILESRPLYNDALYHDMRRRLVEAYFQDFHKHARFQPKFLLNDVLRFWRTLCINYENSRHWRYEPGGQAAKGYVLNFKLKFSRINSCYSFIAHLMNRGDDICPDDVLASAALAPLERLQELRAANPALAPTIDRMLEEYAWFLERNGLPTEELHAWIGDPATRDDAFARSRVFGDGMASLVSDIAGRNGYLRYLII